MTRSPDNHLDEFEIEALATARRHGGPESANAQPDAEIAAHIRNCESCARSVQLLGEAEDMLSSLKRRPTTTNYGCSETIDWYAVATGVTDRHQALQALEHAATCSSCGRLLEEAHNDLSSEATPEEEALIDRLRSSSESWQSAMAGKLFIASTTSPLQSQRKHTGPVFRFWFAAAALVLLCLGTWLTVRQFLGRGPIHAVVESSEPSPLALISQAYSENRTIEPRFPGAPFGELHFQRGSTVSSLDRPSVLLKAESEISDGLRRNPSDLLLIEAMARANLLDGHYDPAIEELSEALASHPDASFLLLDLGTAYYLRAEQTGNARDYGLAIDCQSRYLAVPGNQHDPVALFNRAIAEERAFQFGAALKDWNTFLNDERDKKWHEDGQRRSDELQKSLRNRKRSSIEPQHDPAAAVALLRARAANLESSGWPEPLDEAYLDLALTEWISALSAPAQRASEEHYWSALRTLSEILTKQHHDDWLADLLSGPPTGDWKTGVARLSAAARAIELGDDAETINQASQSLNSFKKSRNRAGVAAAEFELLRAFSQSQEGDQCLIVATRAVRHITGVRYPWLNAEISFDLATCEMLNQNPQQAMKFSRRAEHVARSADYAALALCGEYYQDGVSTQNVASAEAWRRVNNGLGEFWRSPFPPRYGAFFYTDLGFLAEKEQLLYFAGIVGQESVEIHESAPDLLARAASHSWLAEVVEATGDQRRAEAEFQKAAEILASSGPDTRAARATLEIERASLEVVQRNFLLANTHLAEATKNLDAVRDTSRLMQYHEAQGEVDLRTGKRGRAEEELSKAISLIEKAKQSSFSESDLLTWQHDTSHAYRSLLEIYSSDSGDNMRSMAFLEWYRGTPLRFDPGRSSLVQSRRLSQSPFPSLAESGYRQELLAMTSGLPVLAWASFPSVTVIWELDQRGLHFARVPVSSQLLGQTAARFARLCSDPDSDLATLNQYGRQLYDWLVAPISSSLPGSGALILEPDDELNLLPFQALKDKGGTYFGEIYSLAESPGLLYSLVRRPPSPLLPSTTRVLAVGDPLPPASFHGETFSRLRDADGEARDIASHFERRKILSGRDATLNNVLRLLPRSEIFHFAGHAVAHAPGSGLLLAPQRENPYRGVLLASDSLQTQLLQQLQLAVFSGCETAVADRGMMDPGSLVRVFLRAGVPAVVASKWRVDSHASAQLMDLFYVCLLQGDSVPDALARAERSMRSNPLTSHPYYWSGFSTFGG